MDEARAVAFRRDAQRHGRLLAGPHQGKGRPAHAVPSCHRHRSDDLRGGGRQGADKGRWDRADPARGREHALLLQRAAAPGTRHTQYFETGGHRAIYHDGWVATAFHGVPWVLTGSSGNFDADKWELYNIDKDFSEAVDLADKEPGRAEAAQGALRRGGAQV